MTKVQVFKPNHKYRLTKDYHREVWPLIYDAKVGDILVFGYKAFGYAQFYPTSESEDGRYHPVMMKATEAFKLLEEIENLEDK